MSATLEKAIKDALKEDKFILGTRQVINSLKNSKLVVLSESVKKDDITKINEIAQKEKVPVITFKGTSVALGKLCGLQFRIASASFTNIAEATVKSIVKESEPEQ